MVPHFILKTPNGSDKVHVNRHEVVVSSLYYCNQLQSLLIGYNFGAFQLWNIDDLKLCFTSSIHNDHIPVTHFTFQVKYLYINCLAKFWLVLFKEPTDDPRAFSYIWVVHSDVDLQQQPTAAMYTLVFNTKTRSSNGNQYIYEVTNLHL